MKKRIKGNELIFISQINRDGSGTEIVSKENIDFMDDFEFTLISLSITQKTFIAVDFNSYVVKLKAKTP